MKTYEEIISYDCLKEGLRKSCKGVMWKDSVANYRLNAVKNTWKLRQDLLNGTYKTLQEIKSRVEALGLKLNHKTHIFPLKQGIKFLRWRYLLTESGKIVRRMDRRSIVRERRKIRKFGAKIGRGEIPERKLTESYSSWCAHAKQGNTNSIIRNMNVLYCETLQRARKELQNEQNRSQCA